MSVMRIATRGSDLALAQANYIAGRVRSELGLEAELVVIKTTGDRIQNVSLAKIGGKGLFIKEIEEALLDDRADVAIHSGKDLPAKIAPGLVLAAFPERADPRDALVGRTSELSVDTLPEGARIGTGSTRRAALLLAHRPDLQIVPLRGNVPTRIAKIEEESLDAVILACAGLDRLGRSEVISERISADLLLPAVCQGTLALECHADAPLRSEIERLAQPDNAVVVAAERAFLEHLQGDCSVPLACYCELRDDGTVRVRGLVSSADGRRVSSSEENGPAAEADALGRRVAQTVLDGGGREILASLRAAEDEESGL